MKLNFTVITIIFLVAYGNMYGQTVQSNFSSGDEGWTNEGDHVYNPPEYFATGGNPDGYIRNLDQNKSIIWYWVAPAKFLGNHASKYNRTLRYDIYQNFLTDQREAADIVLEGNGLRLLFSTSYNPSLSWTTYLVTLNELSGWVRDTAGYPVVTKAQMQAVLGNITKFMIRGEYTGEVDQDGLDNVIFGGNIGSYAGPGNMAVFNGAGAYINLGNNTLLKPTAQLTVQGWALIKDFNDTYRIVSNTQSGGYSITAEYGKIYFNVRINGNYRSVSGDLPAPGTWHHYALTYNGQILSGYIDGILQGSFDMDGSYPISYNAGNSTLVGAEPGGGSSPESSYGYLPGYVEELSFWNKALTQKQIKDWMCRKLTASHPAYASLAAYYRFNQQKSDVRVIDQRNTVYGTMMNDCVFDISSAPVGDASSYTYGGKVASLKHPDGDSFRIQVTAGNPKGVHIYRTDEAPSITKGATGVGPNDRYFGVFHFGDTTAAYKATYMYKGNPYVTSSAETSLKLYKRDNNAAPQWKNTNATLNTSAKTLIVNGQKTEYIIGASDTALEQKSSVSIGDISIKEGNSGTKQAKFVVKLNKAMQSTTKIAFTTLDSTAKVANNDYKLTTGTIVFEPGTVNDTVVVRIVGDVNVEPNEFFKVVLKDPVNVTMADSVATGRIINDDAAAALEVSAVYNHSKIIVPNLISCKQTWIIQGISGTTNNVIITNANGKIVFNKKNYQNNQNLSALKAGLYFYVVKIENAAGESQEYAGKMVLTE